jgi:hypothetical protein
VGVGGFLEEPGSLKGSYYITLNGVRAFVVSPKGTLLYPEPNNENGWAEATFPSIAGAVSFAEGVLQSQQKMVQNPPYIFNRDAIEPILSVKPEVRVWEPLEVGALICPSSDITYYMKDEPDLKAVSVARVPSESLVMGYFQSFGQAVAFVEGLMGGSFDRSAIQGLLSRPAYPQISNKLECLEKPDSHSQEKTFSKGSLTWVVPSDVEACRQKFPPKVSQKSEDMTLLILSAFEDILRHSVMETRGLIQLLWAGSSKRTNYRWQVSDNWPRTSKNFDESEI